jgi:very-short-patch-repair endonuclease
MPTTYIRHERKPDGERKSKVYVPRWVDPLPWVQGSEPEKMVMAELIRRGIYFQHVPQRNTVGGLVDPTWEADFLFPQYKIWLEVQGSYFHTLPGAVERDALRFAIIEAAGWKPIFWWDFDIRFRLQEIMNAVPEFYRINRDREERAQDRFRNTAGEPYYEGGDGVDHLAGLRKALSNRARPPQKLKVRRRKKRRPK